MLATLSPWLQRCIACYRPKVPPLPLTLFRTLSTHSLSDLSTMTKSSLPALTGAPRLLPSWLLTRLDECCFNGLSCRGALNSLLGVEARGEGLGDERYRTALGSFTGVSVDV